MYKTYGLGHGAEGFHLRLWTRYRTQDFFETISDALCVLTGRRLCHRICNSKFMNRLEDKSTMVWTTPIDLDTAKIISGENFEKDWGWILEDDEDEA